MPENKYLKAMEQAKKHAAQQSVVQSSATQSEPETGPPRGKEIRKHGRPPGKRSNPDWEQVTIFMRTRTKNAVLRKLMDADGEGARDLSEVIDQLVSRWIG